MADDAGFVFCDLRREFPFEFGHHCAAFVADQDPTPDRERLWDYHVTGAANDRAGQPIAA